jgi:vacuolar-type H+-ATPase subunit H
VIRKLYHHIFLIVVLAFSIALLHGCAKPPTKEVESAEQAIAEAKQKEADLYVPDIFAKAEESLKKAKDLIAEKKYKEAKQSAEEALNLAQQTIPMIQPNKGKMKTETEQMIPEVQGSLDEIKSLVAKAVKKKASINREEIQGSIGKWEVDMVTVKDQLQGERIRQAYDQLISIRDQLKLQKDTLTAVLEQEPAARK